MFRLGKLFVIGKHVAGKVANVVIKHPKKFGAALVTTIVLKKGNQELYRFERDILVKEKYTKIEDNETFYMIADENNRIYKFDNSGWRLHYRRAEEWADVNINKEYHVSGVGIRWPFMGWYPRVFYARPIVNEKNDDKFTIFKKLPEIKKNIGKVVEVIKTNFPFNPLNEKLPENKIDDNVKVEKVVDVKRINATAKDIKTPIIDPICYK
jgi:hypothetical protein